jgi:hypothetical protein
MLDVEGPVLAGREGEDLAPSLNFASRISELPKTIPCVVDDNVHSLSLYSEKLSCVKMAVRCLVHAHGSRQQALLFKKSEHFDTLGLITRGSPQ